MNHPLRHSHQPCHKFCPRLDVLCPAWCASVCKNMMQKGWKWLQLPVVPSTLKSVLMILVNCNRLSNSIKCIYVSDQNNKKVLLNALEEKVAGQWLYKNISGSQRNCLQECGVITNLLGWVSLCAFPCMLSILWEGVEFWKVSHCMWNIQLYSFHLEIKAMQIGIV